MALLLWHRRSSQSTRALTYLGGGKKDLRGPARRSALLRLHCISLLLLVVVMVLLLVEMLPLARRGSATGLDARVASI